MKIEWTAHIELFDANHKLILSRDVKVWAFTERNALEQAHAAANKLTNEHAADYWLAVVK